MPQQRHIVRRVTTREHNIRIPKLLHETIDRLLLDLEAICRECPANLPCSRRFKANENYLCHDGYLGRKLNLTLLPLGVCSKVITEDALCVAPIWLLNFLDER